MSKSGFNINGLLITYSAQFFSIIPEKFSIFSPRIINGNYNKEWTGFLSIGLKYFFNRPSEPLAAGAFADFSFST
jgi:hypothetical protein